LSALPLTRLGRLSLGLLLGTPVAGPGQPVHAVLPKPPAPIDDMALLRAIACVETGTTNLSRPCRKVGRAGERSAWQIKAVVWRQYTSAPFASASTDATLANLVAALHLQQLKRQSIVIDGLVATPYWLATSWNRGPRMHSYGERVESLYREFARP
jgi:hypothetical protein